MSEPALISLPLQRTAEVPFRTYKQSQAALARKRLFPLTIFYTLYAIFVLALAFSTTHPWTTVAFFSAGWVTWTFVEHLFHRYVLHGRFPAAKVSSADSCTSGSTLSTGIITRGLSMGHTSVVN
jgi:hypothetical protein